MKVEFLIPIKKSLYTKAGFLKKIMSMCGCESTEGFIKVTHSASINDTFWIKSETESVTWKDVSLYHNEFNETISKLAFEGVGLYGIELSSTVPELSTEGSFRKCWRREDGEIYLYKRGQDGAFNAGLEPYCEVMASELAGKLCRDSVQYDIVRLYGEQATRCKLFTSETEGYVPVTKYSVEKNARELLQFFSRIGAEEDFRRMVVLDGLTFNVDRHAGNYGVLIDNDTLQPIRMAPIFDFNLSMLPYVIQDDFDDIGGKLLEYGPRIGEDFTRMAQLLLTQEIRADLVALKGFQFSFRGDEKYPEERVKAMEKLVNRQIEGILDKNVLYTRDVFVPKMYQESSVKQDERGENKEQEKKAVDVIDSIKDTNFVGSAYMEYDENGNFVVHMPYLGQDNTEFLYQVADESLEIEIDGDIVALEICEKKWPEMYGVYKKLYEYLKVKG